MDNRKYKRRSKEQVKIDIVKYLINESIFISSFKEIAKKTGSNFPITKKFCEELESLGIVDIERLDNIDGKAVGVKINWDVVLPIKKAYGQ